MLLGFGLIAKFIAPRAFFPETIPVLRYLDAATKAALGLLLSVTWLFIWDRQVRVFFFSRKAQHTQG